MKQMVEFFSYQLGRKMRVPIEIIIESDNTRFGLNVHVPEQHFFIDEMLTYTEATWTGEDQS